MLDRIKRRLIHFDTDGTSIVSDFVSTRQRRAGMFRRVVHACFYIQCVLVLACAVCGFVIGEAVNGIILTVGAAASAGVALMAVSGDFAVRTISYMLDLVYAVICFIVGGRIFTLCGVLMLIAAVAALVGFAAGYFRRFLLDYSPLKLTPEDYTLTDAAPKLPQGERQELMEQPKDEPTPAPEPKSELLLIAEQVSQIMNAPRLQPEEQMQHHAPIVQQNESKVFPQQAAVTSSSAGSPQGE